MLTAVPDLRQRFARARGLLAAANLRDRHVAWTSYSARWPSTDDVSSTARTPYAAAPGVSRFRVILMYHHIVPVEVAPLTSPPEQGWSFTHTPSMLACHIETLRRRGRRFVSLAEYVASIDAHGTPPTAAVHLTFDDGWLDNFQYAWPLLRDLAVPATFFVTTQNRDCCPDPRYMSVRQLRELVAGGMTVGGHTRSHPNLTVLPRAAQRSEIAGCKADLEAALGCPVDWFAYPGGAFNLAVVDQVKAAGFRGAVCSLGPAHNGPGSKYWLFREIPGQDLTSLRDRARVWRPTRRVWELRVKHRLRSQHLA